MDFDTRAANLVAAWGLARAAGHLAEDLPDDSWASSAATRAIMQGNRGQDTKPELLLRSLLHKRGLRYRVGERPLPELPRRADVVFRRERVAIFVDGCFWHGCPEHLRPARKNASFWSEKIAGNKRRDAETNAALTQAGWAVVRVWEHDDPAEACERISELVRERRADSQSAA
ncbi:very short patch repair endonuclease [Streptomyces parvus]|uniref:very short patch repair endonuclease n=1 Tax=Streptomyces parvus TaxID=66428 RepID=UPI0033C525A2